jgi:hypothetical protein
VRVHFEKAKTCCDRKELPPEVGFNTDETGIYNMPASLPKLYLQEGKEIFLNESRRKFSDNDSCVLHESIRILLIVKS